MVIVVLAEAEPIPSVGTSVSADNAEWIFTALMQNRKTRKMMSDLIRKKDAVSAISDLLINRFNEKVLPTWNDVYHAIDSIPSAEPERKWIPVTEALPEDNRQVLVYAQSTNFALAKYDEMRESDGEYKKQWVTFDAWKPFYTIKNVLAWMPLPEPWRGDR